MGTDKKEKDTPDIQIAKRLSDADKAKKATFDKAVEHYTAKGSRLGSKNKVINHYIKRK